MVLVLHILLWRHQEQLMVSDLNSTTSCRRFSRDKDMLEWLPDLQLQNLIAYHYEHRKYNFEF
jgi:hypothetical protein